MFKRKSNRVQYFKYQGCFVYFVTICTAEKRAYFIDNQLINALLTRLREDAAKFSFQIFTYCFMPDHLHLLLVGNENSKLIDFIKMFKQKTGYYFKQKNGVALWQKSYYDHVIRKQESINDIALYIFDNPVRKKLAEDFRKYPFLGSDIIDMEYAYQLYTERGRIDIRTLLECN